MAGARARPQLLGAETRVHILQLAFEQRLLAHRGGVGVIVEPVIVGLEPELRLAFWLERDPRVEGVVEKAEQRRLLRPSRRRLCHTRTERDGVRQYGHPHPGSSETNEKNPF